jgi:hypothetical protein
MPVRASPGALALARQEPPQRATPVECLRHLRRPHPAGTRTQSAPARALCVRHYRHFWRPVKSARYERTRMQVLDPFADSGVSLAGFPGPRRLGVSAEGFEPDRPARTFGAVLSSIPRDISVTMPDAKP